jgi:hypothetical protein
LTRQSKQAPQFWNPVAKIASHTNGRTSAEKTGLADSESATCTPDHAKGGDRHSCNQSIRHFISGLSIPSVSSSENWCRKPGCGDTDTRERASASRTGWRSWPSQGSEAEPGTLVGGEFELVAVHKGELRAACKTRVRVADVGREEFEEADRRALAGGNDECWQRRRADQDELIHDARITTGSKG